MDTAYITDSIQNLWNNNLSKNTYFTCDRGVVTLRDFCNRCGRHRILTHIIEHLQICEYCASLYNTEIRMLPVITDEEKAWFLLAD